MVDAESAAAAAGSRRLKGGERRAAAARRGRMRWAALAHAAGGAGACSGRCACAATPLRPRPRAPCAGAPPPRPCPRAPGRARPPPPEVGWGQGGRKRRVSGAGRREAAARAAGGRDRRLLGGSGAGGLRRCPVPASRAGSRRRRELSGAAGVWRQAPLPGARSATRRGLPLWRRARCPPAGPLTVTGCVVLTTPSMAVLMLFILASGAALALGSIFAFSRFESRPRAVSAMRALGGEPH